MLCGAFGTLGKVVGWLYCYQKSRYEICLPARKAGPCGSSICKLRGPDSNYQSFKFEDGEPGSGVVVFMNAAIVVSGLYPESGNILRLQAPLDYEVLWSIVRLCPVVSSCLMV